MPSAPASTASVSRATSDTAGASGAVVSAASTPTSAESASCGTSGKPRDIGRLHHISGAGASGTAASGPGPSLRASGVTPASGCRLLVRLPGRVRRRARHRRHRHRLPPKGVRVTANGPLTLPATIVVVGEGVAAAIGLWFPLSKALTSRVTSPAASRAEGG